MGKVVKAGEREREGKMKVRRKGGRIRERGDGREVDAPNPENQGGETIEGSLDWQRSKNATLRAAPTSSKPLADGGVEGDRADGGPLYRAACPMREGLASLAPLFRS